MSKHRYSSSEFNRVDWDSLVQRLAGGRAVLPVDAAKQDYAAAVLAGDGTVLARFKWVHPQQTAAVVQPVHWLAQRVRVEVVMEPSGTYGDALLWQLRQAGIALYRVSPKRVHDAAEVFDGVPSLHDAKAADINATRKQLHALERQIEQRVAGTPEFARLGAVTGKVTAAVLLAALGRPQDYPDAASYTLRHRAQPNAAAASTRDSSRSPSAAAAWRASTSTSPPYA